MHNILKLGRDCQLEYTPHSGGALCYTEHSPDSWYSDTETEIDIDKDKATEIVAWLCEKYQLQTPEGLVLLKEIHDHYESEYKHPHPDGPGHCHSKTGHWDADGRPCEWCATWNRVRSFINQNAGGERTACPKGTNDNT